jgi:hypothetical protein
MGISCFACNAQIIRNLMLHQCEAAVWSRGVGSLFQGLKSAKAISIQVDISLAESYDWFKMPLSNKDGSRSRICNDLTIGLQEVVM